MLSLSRKRCFESQIACILLLLLFLEKKKKKMASGGRRHPCEGAGLCLIRPCGRGKEPGLGLGGCVLRWLLLYQFLPALDVVPQVWLV